MTKYFYILAMHCIKQIKAYCLVLSFVTISCLLVFPAKGQAIDTTSQVNSSTRILNSLKMQLANGQKRAIRDLATLLEDKKYNKQARLLLNNYCLFPDFEQLLSQKHSKQTILDFYYQQEDIIKFSPLLNMYYTIPVEELTVTHDIKITQAYESGFSDALSNAIKDYETAINNKDGSALVCLTEEISNLRGNTNLEFIIQQCKSGHLDKINWQQNENEIFYGLLGSYLAEDTNEENYQFLLDLLKMGKMDIPTAKRLLSIASTLAPPTTNHRDSIYQYYSNPIDSLGTLNAVNQYAYQQAFGFSPRYFEEKVDYYAMLLSYADEQIWIQRNAWINMLQTQHPRVLFYLAAQLLHYRDAEDNIPDFFKPYSILTEMTKLTGVSIAVDNEKGQLVWIDNYFPDETAKRNYVQYWANHYQDYEWDGFRNRYVNTDYAQPLTETYERMFRLLNSTNDSVAFNSYKKLTQGDPYEIKQLNQKYRDLLRSYNKTLPSIKRGYLEQMAMFTYFCTLNKRLYIPPLPLQQQLNQLLDSELSQKKRNTIENQLIQQTPLEHIACIEYWAVLNAKNQHLSLSASRILDWLYSKYWETIVNNDKELRLYLKKSHLFERFDILGVCTQYLNKFRAIDPDLRSRLEIMLKAEQDSDIANQLHLIIAKNDEKEGIHLLINHPEWIPLQEIKQLPPPSALSLTQLLEVLKNSENPAFQSKALLYIETHPTIKAVPTLFAIQDKVSEKEFAAALNSIYKTTLKQEEWINLWNTHQQTYTNWDKEFYEQHKLKITQDSITNIKDINAVTLSQHFNYKKDKKLIIQALSKLSKMRYLQRLRMEPRFNIKEDLSTFEQFELTYRELDDVPNLFDLSVDVDLMVTFLIEKIKQFDLEDRGKLLNRLFKNNWFLEAAFEGQFSTEQIAYISQTLDTYLTESDFISEFEEQATLVNTNLLKCSHLSLEEQLQLVNTLNLDPNIAANLQTIIIARVTFGEIPTVLKQYQQLSPAYLSQTGNFLNKDFGLPIFGLTSEEVSTETIAFFEAHQNNQQLIYKHYLQAFDVDIFKTNDSLDYEKVYNALKYDVVMPFVEGGGIIRDYYTYGVIKLLELEFDTRLGFHEKKNENQTFYIFSSRQRAEKWRNYLIEQQLVNPKIELTPSFNITLLERT